MVSHPLTARIDLAAFRHNIKTIKNIVGKTVSILPVIKADGYGHGVAPLAVECLKSGAEMLGLGTVEEGIEIRRNKIAIPILLLDSLFKDQAADALKFRLTPVVHSLEIARDLNLAARKADKKLAVHVKFDSGMGRLGIWHTQAKAALTKIASMSNLRIEGIMTHLASASDRESPQTELQLMRFNGVLNTAETLGIKPKWIHAANSAAILNFKKSHFNMVRPGIALYGAPPVKAKGVIFRPVMTLVSKIISIKNVPAGEGVGYNATYTTPRSKKVGVVMGGYADGINRMLSNSSVVVLRGKTVPMVGSVCMDNFMIDLSRAPDARVGDTVTLLGGGFDETSAERIAKIAQTIPYEIFCNIGNRVKRVAKG